MFQTKEKRALVQSIDNAREVFTQFAQAIRELSRLSDQATFWAKIAIDGLAAVGKGTLTKLLQKEFGIEVISSGHFYRVLTWMYLGFNKKFDKNMSMREKIGELIKGLEVHIQDNRVYISHPFVNRPGGSSGMGNFYGIVLEENEIRTAEINATIAEIAECVESQDFVDEQQRRWIGHMESGILEGRQAYAVFKEEAANGEVTLVYMYASQKELERREIRREASKLGRELTPEDKAAVVQRLKDRNEKDLSREHNPPLSPKEAKKSDYYSFLLDTTNLNEHQVAILFLLELFSDNQAVQTAFFNSITN